jgi:hypothetical protein
MKARIDAGTDVAMIGAWDARRGAESLTPPELKHLSDTLEADAAQGRLFLLHTGADGGGPIDVYVDEAVPREVQERLVPMRDREFLLAVPSGALVVGGVEYYRSPQARITDDNSTVAVPAGDYAVRCYAAKDEEQSPRSEEELRKLVGDADLQYYDRINRTGCIVGALTLLLFPMLSFPLGWKLALPITAVVFLSFFPVLAWLLKRNVRYQRLHRVVPVFRLQNQDPTYVFALRVVRDRTGLKGGSLTQ